MPNPNPQKTVYKKYLTREIGCVTCRLPIHLAHQKRHYATGCLGEPIVTEEDHQIRKYLIMKKMKGNSGKGPMWHMTLSETRSKLREAGITMGDIGKAGWHLARYGDTGDYTVDNCRFVHHTTNLNERRVRPRKH